MSAVEALAEVLRQGIHDYVALSDERPLTADDPSLPDSMASALVAAIRSMPAEQVAELIGGSVRYGAGRRVVGPWLPLGVSPETNGEQK